MFAHMVPFEMYPFISSDINNNNNNNTNSAPYKRCTDNKDEKKIKYSSVIDDYLSAEDRIKEEKRKQRNLRRCILKCIENSVTKKSILNFRKYSKTIQEYEYPQNYICINCPEYAKLVRSLKNRNISIDTPPIYSFLDNVEKFRVHYYTGKRHVQITTH